MIQMPLQDIIKKITENAEITEEEVNEKISEKLEQLKGLISKEGAAHIIANELGVKIIPAPTGNLEIKNVLMGMRDVEVTGRVMQSFGIREFKRDDRTGKVANLILADESGSIRTVCWGSQADKTQDLKEGDIVKITGGYVRANQGTNEIHLNDQSKMIINPEGVTINIDTAAKGRIKIEELTEKNQDVEIMGTIVQVFDPRFYEVCPECNKRIKPSEAGEFICPEHGKVNPDYSYLMNIFLDDGTGNIQAVFFRNIAEALLDKQPEQMLAYKDNPAAIEQMKNDLLGIIIKVSGRVNKNTMFERLEFVARSVDRNPNPEEELKNMQDVSEVKTEEIE